MNEHVVKITSEFYQKLIPMVSDEDTIHHVFELLDGYKCDLEELLRVDNGLVVHDYVKRLPRHKTKKYGERNLDKVTDITIHHAAIPNLTAEQAASYHVNVKGWAGIGYHYYIERDGKVKKCNRLQNLTWHNGGNNVYSIGVCLSGNFEIEQPTTAQIAACVALVQHLQNDVFERPFAVRGHNEYKATACPGTNLDMELIRTKTQFLNEKPILV